jgi:hypothetical protein
VKIKLAGYGVGLLALFFLVSAISRIISPTEDASGHRTAPAAPGLIAASAAALANLFRNTIN